MALLHRQRQVNLGAPAAVEMNNVDAEMAAKFLYFAFLPAELRIRIWELAFTPHIIRWVRIDDEATLSSNKYPYSRRLNPISQVSREAREAIFSFAKFVKLGDLLYHRYSPSHDYLHLDTAWRELSKPQLEKDPFVSLPFDYCSITRVMINPNYTEERMKPGLAFEKLPALKEVLVVADEKSVGLKDKFMLASVYDLQKYFQVLKGRNAKITVPYIAIGCLGRVGSDRTRIAHSTEDRRQLIAIFENQFEIKEHLNKVREEETRFLKSTFNQKSGLKLRFKPGVSPDVLTRRTKQTTSGMSTSLPHTESGQNTTILSSEREEHSVLTATDDLPGLDELPSYGDSILTHNSLQPPGI